MPRARAWFLGLAIAAIAIGYAILAHLSNSTSNTCALGVVLAVAPALLIAAALAWRSRRRIRMLLLCAFVTLLVYHYWPLLARHYSWIYLLQQTAAYGLLGFTFGRSLGPGRTPLCTHWATLHHGTLSPAAVRYTRAVTLTWTLFFVAVTITLVALFMLAPLRVWSAFANFGTLPLIAALFIVEYGVRGRILPDMQHAGILAGVRAYWHGRRDRADLHHG